jgi:hypothetical protein
VGQNVGFKYYEDTDPETGEEIGAYRCYERALNRLYRKFVAEGRKRVWVFRKNPKFDPEKQTIDTAVHEMDAWNAADFICLGRSDEATVEQIRQRNEAEAKRKESTVAEHAAKRLQVQQTVKVELPAGMQIVPIAGVGTAAPAPAKAEEPEPVGAGRRK